MYKFFKKIKSVLCVLLAMLCFLPYIEYRIERNLTRYKRETKVHSQHNCDYKKIASTKSNPIHRMFVKEKMRQYQYLLNQKYTPPENYINKYPNRIWVFWDGGFDKAPEVVKICFNSIKKHSGGRIIETLDDENLEKYLKLPDYIIQKYKEGKITKAAFSDIVRTVLLRDYGGLWLDASFYLTGAIPQYIFDTELFAEIDANHKFLNFSNESTAFAVIESYILATNKPNTYFFKVMTDLLFAYWKNHDSCNYWYWYSLCTFAADEDLTIHRLIKNVYDLNRKHDFCSLGVSKLFNKKFDPKKWNKIKKCHLHKLNARTRRMFLKIKEDSFGKKLLRGELEN